MNRIYLITIVTLFNFLFAVSANAQDYFIDVILKNPPSNKIFLGTVQGDNYTITDSTDAEGELLQFKINNQALPGIYRIKLGYLSEQNQQDDFPQLLDFVFNKEDIVLETDFYSPESTTRVIQSTENEIWVAFKNKENALKNSLYKLEKDLNYNWGINNSDEAIKIATEYNQLQIERDLFITQTISADSNLFVAKLIKTFQEPLLDGYLTKNQRNTIFQKEYLNTIDFSDEALINSQVYTDKIFSYLVSFNQSSLTQQEREDAYKQAVEIIFGKLNKNKMVFEFIKDYLKHGFEVLQMPKLVDYIAKKEFAIRI